MANVFGLQLDYSHSKDYNYDPHYGRYDTSATLDEMKQFFCSMDQRVWSWGTDNVGAGVDWQKQTTTRVPAILPEGYDQRNTGVYLTGLQQLLTSLWKRRRAVMTTPSLVVTVRSKPARDGVYRRLSLYCLYGTSYKAPNLGQLYSYYGNRTDPEKRVNSGKAHLGKG